MLGFRQRLELELLQILKYVSEYQYLLLNNFYLKSTKLLNSYIHIYIYIFIYIYMYIYIYR